MNENTERIDHYLRSVDLPRCESEPHRHALRRQVLSEIERKRTMSVRNRTWKLTVAIAALIGGGALAAAVGVKVYRYHFEGVGADGAYHFSSEPETIYERTYQDPNGDTHTFRRGRSGWTSVSPADAADPEQAQRDLEEIALLREQDRRELVGVIDNRVNGHLHRTYSFKYALADGRTRTIGEGDSGGRDEDAVNPAQMEQDLQEVARLRGQGLREVVNVTEIDVEGEITRILMCRYVLSDGREMTIGEGDPTLTPPAKYPSPEQIEEVYRLKALGRGQPLDGFERTLYGRAFNFESRLFTLADGTVVTLSEGQAAVTKTMLSPADWAELGRLMGANAGEELNPYQDAIGGQTFTFAPKRYVLSDGTEVIFAQGTR
jgi:hypothetical protein